jgi:membrane protein implicated in regulation of membrane protease activity
LLLWFWLSRYLPKLPYFNKLILTTTAGGTVAGAATAGAFDASVPMPGDNAIAVTDLRPGGSARIESSGQVTPVVSESGFVKAGDRLIVREVSGNRIVVRVVT